MSRSISFSKKLFVFILMLVMVAVFSAPVSVHALQRDNNTQIQNNALADALNYTWKASTSGSVLTLEVVDTRATLPGAGKWGIEAQTVPGSWVGVADFDGNKCVLNIDFAKQKRDNGLYNFLFRVKSYTDNHGYVIWDRTFFIEIQDNQVSFYNPYGQPSIDFLNALNADDSPDKYKDAESLILKKSAGSSYDAIVKKAQEITAKCSNDASKTKAVHDWICQNIAYDMTRTYAGESGIEAAFTKGYAVCGGYAQLTSLMCRAAGVPCMEINGYAKGLLEEGDQNKGINHAWNAVYYNGTWNYLDTTWDSANRYYGEGNAQNETGKEADHRFFDLPASTFGATHHATGVAYKPAALKKIKVTNFKTSYELGEELSKTYNIQGVGDFGETWPLAYNSGATFEGYDSQKEGEQTITVTYSGVSTQVKVTVGAKYTGIKAVPDSTVKYKAGENFTPKYKLYAVTKDGKQVEITDLSQVKLSGYDVNKTGKQTVTVKYQKFTTTFDISVGSDAEYDKITAAAVLGYTYVKGDKIVPEYKLYGYKDKEKTEITDLSDVKLTVPEETGLQKVTVEYKGLKTTFNITIIDPLGITFEPSVKEYKVGDKFKTTGRLYYKVSETKRQLVKDTDSAEPVFSGYDMNKAGKQTVTVKYKKYSTSFEIEVKGKGEAKDPSSFTITFHKTFTYTGKRIEPEVTIVDADGKTLRKGLDYTSASAYNKEVGIATLVIYFSGDYKGTEAITTEFKIVPKGTSISKITAKSKKLIVRIKAQKAGTTGYEVRYSLKKNMKGSKTVKVAANKKSAVISRLKAKKTYYVQVRTYTKTDKGIITSGWSKKVAKTTGK